MTLCPNLEYPLFGTDTFNTEKKIASHKLIQNFALNLTVKPECPAQEPPFLEYLMLKIQNLLFFGLTKEERIISVQLCQRAGTL